MGVPDEKDILKDIGNKTEKSEEEEIEIPLTKEEQLLMDQERNEAKKLNEQYQSLNQNNTLMNELLINDDIKEREEEANNMKKQIEVKENEIETLKKNIEDLE